MRSSNSQRAGSPVIAGSISLDGALLIKSSGAGSATRWAKICRSVREALSHRSAIGALPTTSLASLCLSLFSLEC